MEFYVIVKHSLTLHIYINYYSRTSNNGHCRGIQILSVIGGVRYLEFVKHLWRRFGE
jgi:hypothetical protein